MWQHLGSGFLRGIGTMVGVGAVTTIVIGGGMMYADRKSKVALDRLSKTLNPGKRDLIRYTSKELQEIVGRIPVEKWTDEQVEKLHQRYKDRVKKFNERCDQMNRELRADKQKHPEKYTGFKGLIAYGPPDIYSTGNYDAQIENYYNAFKSKNDEVDDKDYQIWIDSEKERLDRLQAENFAKMIVVVDEKGKSF